MTALNFCLLPESLDLVTDTLCTAGAQNKPYIYNTKVHALPHLHGALAMKGQGLFALECLKVLNSQIIARDVVEADPDIPKIYRETWQRHLDFCKSRGEDMEDAKASIYHFGWVPSEGRVVGFEYRAVKGFASERVTDGCWLHPSTVTGIVIRHPDDLVRITKKQKKIDDALPPEKRAGIGGDFHRLFLTKDNISIQRVFRSGDFDKVFQEMVDFGKIAPSKQPS